MGKYIAKRILSGVITIVILITACFFLMHAIPGSPFSKGEQGVPEAVMQRLNEKYGLDQPLYKQYFTYLNQILHGDFGISYKNSSVQVNDLIERGFPISARIGILAVLLSLVIGVLLGVTSAVKRGSLFDDISMVIATIGVCVPLFVISVLLLYLFAGVLKWLPTYGLTTWKHYILPVTCLSFSPIAYIARMTRSSMLEVMQQDYIRTARAKGVAERMVILKHGLRNAILPVVTYLGTLIANLLTVHRRASVRDSGSGQILRGFHHRARLQHHHGRHHLPRRVRRGLQSDCGRGLRRHRPAREARRVTGRILWKKIPVTNCWTKPASPPTRFPAPPFPIGRTRGGASARTSWPCSVW